MRSLQEIGKSLAAAIAAGERITLSAEDAAVILHAMITGEALPEPVKLPSGEVENFTLRIAGKLTRCPHGCGCNVFHKPDNRRLDLYQCNSCDGRFEAK